MVLFVTGVGTLIHLYSVGYMHGDERFSAFFVYLNLFVFSMLLLVLGDNLLLTFLGWEGVGVCSYLLISFWFERDAAAPAPARRPSSPTGSATVGFLVAMFLIFSPLGSLTYVRQVSSSAPTGLAGGTAHGHRRCCCSSAPCGKSAQLPLYVWLPDAMEGPTPVSALIHAATMVTAGVYLVARVAPVLAAAPTACPTVIAVVGAATALFAATMRRAPSATSSGCSPTRRSASSATCSWPSARAPTWPPSSTWSPTPSSRRCSSSAPGRSSTACTTSRTCAAWARCGVHAGHRRHLHRRVAGHRRHPAVRRLLVEGRDPAVRLAGQHGRSGPSALVTALLTAFYMSRQVFLVFFGEPRWEEADATSPERGRSATPEHEPRGRHRRRRATRPRTTRASPTSRRG